MRANSVGLLLFSVHSLCLRVHLIFFLGNSLMYTIFNKSIFIFLLLAYIQYLFKKRYIHNKKRSQFVPEHPQERIRFIMQIFLFHNWETVFKSCYFLHLDSLLSPSNAFDYNSEENGKQGN